MSRSPLAYPLTRGIDGDSGGAADLQTDIMRFMAILALCLVAIFALVQSLPMAPDASVPDSTSVPPPQTVAERAMTDAPVAQIRAAPPRDQDIKPAAERPIALTRPTWDPKYTPAPRPPERAEATKPTRTEVSTGDTAPSTTPATVPIDTVVPTSPAGQEGFTLRFESNLVLTRLVASGQVGFYAIEPGRAQRMSVHNSRISFWEASTPNEFHEMETATVPQSVVDALGRSGADASAVSFGVTLPSRLQGQLAQIMNSHRGGALVIGASGDLQLEAGG